MVSCIGNVIQLTDSVTLKLLGIVRTAGLVLACVMLFGEEVTAAQGLSYAVVMVAFYVYNKN